MQVTEELTVISRRLVKERMSLRLVTSSEADNSFYKRKGTQLALQLVINIKLWTANVCRTYQQVKLLAKQQ